MPEFRSLILNDISPRMPEIAPSKRPEPAPAKDVFQKACEALLSMQRSDGYWWFSLEANETIGAEFIFLMHYLNAVDEEILSGIAERIKDVQRSDGSWALYHDGPPDLSSTIECYFALRLAGENMNQANMRAARDFILSRGGVPKSRVFTRIHLALFGLIPWNACPEMPAEAVFMPSWFPLNIYAFASWARATIVPLLGVMSLKPIFPLSKSIDLEELYCEPLDEVDWSFKTTKPFLSWERAFITLDKILKYTERIPFKPLRKLAINKCKKWTWEHVSRTEDIYPAMAYAAILFKSLGYSNDSPEIAKPFDGLKRFQQSYATNVLPALPDELVGTCRGELMTRVETPIDPRTVALGTQVRATVHQQCCISPVWDTPWTLTALIESGIAVDSPAVCKAARWLLKKQVTDFRGDWKVTNPKALAGGWSFEFENDCFPDVDDTIQVLNILERVDLPQEVKSEAIRRGYLWLLSMQNDDGGWAAFDRNNCRQIVNKIPFSDHGACLDPSSPDITGRVLELMALRGYMMDDTPVRRALDYIWKHQEIDGSWAARWGIDYIYGTWCVLTGLSAINWDLSDRRVRRAVGFLLAAQRHDGSFGESPASYDQKKYVPWHEGVPSQTAWGLMALVQAGEANSPAAGRAARWLEERCNENGTWDEEAFTGTGFPGHFYIRYHGYRHFFPLLALARYRNALTKS